MSGFIAWGLCGACDGEGFYSDQHPDDSTATINRQCPTCAAHFAEVERLEAELNRIASNIHYPECWDTMAYPTLADAVCGSTRCEQCGDA